MCNVKVENKKINYKNHHDDRQPSIHQIKMSQQDDVFCYQFNIPLIKYGNIILTILAPLH
jgi:hypothetical protein